MPDNTEEQLPNNITADEILAKWDADLHVYIWQDSLPAFLIKWQQFGNNEHYRFVEHACLDTDANGTYEVMFGTKDQNFNTDEEFLSKVKNIR
jgi:hypothetical protein